MIKLKVVRWKNFLATGNQFLEVNLDKEPMTLIVGKNGAGKSTLIDAITFSLFGKPFKKINKGQLMNTVNEKDLVTEIEFSIGNNGGGVNVGIEIESKTPQDGEIYRGELLLTGVINLTENIGGGATLGLVFAFRGDDDASSDEFQVRANYSVIEVLNDDLPRILSAGRYLDRVVLENGLLRFKEKRVIYDSVLVPNSLIYPL